MLTPVVRMDVSPSGMKTSEATSHAIGLRDHNTETKYCLSFAGIPYSSKPFFGHERASMQYPKQYHCKFQNVDISVLQLASNLAASHNPIPANKMSESFSSAGTNFAWHDTRNREWSNSPLCLKCFTAIWGLQILGRLTSRHSQASKDCQSLVGYL